MHNPVALDGPDGSNPLGFLAALGTLVLADRACHGARLSWRHANAKWSPLIHNIAQPSTEDFVQWLTASLITDPAIHPAMKFAELPSPSRALPVNAAQIAFMCALGPSWAHDQAVTSQLQMARKDYFRGNLESIIKKTTASHLNRTLCKEWDYSDPLNNLSLHFEPSEDRRHAYQWAAPTGDTTRSRTGGMIGANRLAIEALLFFTSLPHGDRLRTLGFSGTRAGQVTWTWPIWSGPLTLDSVRSALALPELQAPDPDRRALQARGIPAAFRTRRILVGKTPNLTPSQQI